MDTKAINPLKTFNPKSLDWKGTILQNKFRRIYIVLVQKAMTIRYSELIKGLTELSICRVGVEDRNLTKFCLIFQLRQNILFAPVLDAPIQLN